VFAEPIGISIEGTCLLCLLQSPTAFIARFGKRGSENKAPVKDLASSMAARLVDNAQLEAGDLNCSNSGFQVQVVV
jgi:hypothetical protein